MEFPWLKDANDRTSKVINAESRDDETASDGELEQSSQPSPSSDSSMARSTRAAAARAAERIREQHSPARSVVS